MTFWGDILRQFSVHNAVVDVNADAKLLCFRVCVILVVRFTIAGAYHPQLRRVPCVLDFICRRPEMSLTKKSKYFENLWYVFWHTTVSMRALHLFSVAKWRALLETGRFERAFFLNWAEHRMEREEQEYYLWQLAFWVSALVYLGIENRRSDFQQMVVHHLATIALVTFSYGWNYWRIGLVVLLLHDCVDIFLYATKASKEMRLLPRIVTELLFLLFTLLFLVLRLLLFPYVCVWTALRTGMHELVDPILGGDPFPLDAKMMAAGVGLYSMPILLCVLFALHCFWFCLILRIIRKTLRDNATVGETGDIRSGSDCSPASSPLQRGRQAKLATTQEMLPTTHSRQAGARQAAATGVRERPTTSKVPLRETAAAATPSRPAGADKKKKR